MSDCCASSTDIDTAQAAGIAAVGYATSSDTAEVFRARGADAAIEDLTELRRLPPPGMPPGLVRG